MQLRGAILYLSLPGTLIGNVIGHRKRNFVKKGTFYWKIFAADSAQLPQFLNQMLMGSSQITLETDYAL
jgi:hypothetical protein